MKLQNLLIYHVAKTALFIVAFVGGLVALLEMIELFTGRTFTIGSADGFGSDSGIYAGRSFYDRLIFLLPGILIALTAAYVCWQLGKMLYSIQKNKQFYEPNYQRLFNSGASIVIVNILLLVISMLSSNAGKIVVDSTAGGKKIIGDDYSFTWSWVAVGCLLMILAKVFQKGSEIQEDHDLAL